MFISGRPPASMEPQLYRCGNPRLRHDTHSGRLGFNGAATLSLRKFEPLDGLPHPCIASMEPQLYRCGNPCCLHRCWPWRLQLQWSRNFIVAEILCRAGRPPRGGSASMEPQLYRCGNLIPYGNHAVAETASMEPQLYRCGNFVSFAAYTKLFFMLQWSRNFIVAEI